MCFAISVPACIALARATWLLAEALAPMLQSPTAAVSTPRQRSACRRHRAHVLCVVPLTLVLGVFGLHISKWDRHEPADGGLRAARSAANASMDAQLLYEELVAEMRGPRGLVLAHRFGHLTGPYSLHHALQLLEQGVRHLELDVHLMHDGEYAVHHKFTLDESTPAPPDETCWSAGAAGLATLNMYGVRDQDDPPFAPPPTLRQVWEAVRATNAVLWIQPYSGREDLPAHLAHLGITPRRAVVMGDFLSLPARQAALLPFINAGFHAMWMWMPPASDQEMESTLRWMRDKRVYFALFGLNYDAATVAKWSAALGQYGIWHGQFSDYGRDFTTWADTLARGGPESRMRLCVTNMPRLMLNGLPAPSSAMSVTDSTRPKHGWTVLGNEPHGGNVRSATFEARDGWVRMTAKTRESSLLANLYSVPRRTAWLGRVSADVWQTGGWFGLIVQRRGVEKLEFDGPRTRAEGGWKCAFVLRRSSDGGVAVGIEVYSFKSGQEQLLCRAPDNQHAPLRAAQGMAAFHFAAAFNETSGALEVTVAAAPAAATLAVAAVPDSGVGRLSCDLRHPDPAPFKTTLGISFDAVGSIELCIENCGSASNAPS